MTDQRVVKVYRLKDSTTFAERCEIADSVLTRTRGLMGRAALENGAGLLIEPCNSIHTFFMRFPIDVAYLGSVPRGTVEGDHERGYVVLAVRRSLKPWRLDFPVFGARAVLELPAGAASKMTEGDVLCLS